MGSSPEDYQLWTVLFLLVQDMPLFSPAHLHLQEILKASPMPHMLPSIVTRGRFILFHSPVQHLYLLIHFFFQKWHPDYHQLCLLQRAANRGPLGLTDWKHKRKRSQCLQKNELVNTNIIQITSYCCWSSHTIVLQKCKQWVQDFRGKIKRCNNWSFSINEPLMSIRRTTSASLWPEDDLQHFWQAPPCCGGREKSALCILVVFIAAE